MLEERVAQLERQMSDLQRLFKTAIGFDENLVEHSELVREIIAEQPGHSQRGICILAKQRFDLSRSRVIEILRAGIGKYWTVQFGWCNSLLHHPITNGTCAEVGETRAESSSSGANYAEVSRVKVVERTVDYKGQSGTKSWMGG